MTKIIFILLFLLAFLPIIMLYLPFYCYVFEHKTWKAWQYWLEHYDDFVFDYDFDDGTCRFTTKDGKYRAYIWKNKMASIHNLETKDCLCTFFKEQSREMAKLLMNKIENR